MIENRSCYSTLSLLADLHELSLDCSETWVPVFLLTVLLIVPVFLDLSPAASHFNAATELSNIGTLMGRNRGI